MAEKSDAQDQADTTPATDPTNPYRQESVDTWARAEQVSVNKQDEPGLTDQDKHDRNPTR